MRCPSCDSNWNQNSAIFLLFRLFSQLLPKNGSKSNFFWQILSNPGSISKFYSANEKIASLPNWLELPKQKLLLLFEVSIN
jgi:hypothetical protein